MNPQMLQTAIVEILPLISEVDLHIAQLSLVLLTSVANKYPKAMIGAYEAILTEVMSLVRSPLLQGAALVCTMNLFAAHPLHKQVQSIIIFRCPSYVY